jgi:pimeloyl-ACP methyl ester carboxylesterase
MGDDIKPGPTITDRHLAVADCELHIHTGGSVTALPPIVLEAGGGCVLEVWQHVEQVLAPHTPVLSYERVGIGSSRGRLGSVSAAAVTQRLTALLQASGTQTPAIMVGHSLGGLYLRHFAATRPDLVAGLVLLDATPEDMPLPRFFSWKPTVLMWLLHGVARIGLIQWLARRVMPADSPAVPPQYFQAIARFQHIRAVLREIQSLQAIQREVAALPAAAALLPTLSISAGTHPKAVTPQQVARFRQSHEQLAAAGLPPHSRHVRIEGATHMSLLTDPQHAATVAAAVLDFARDITQSPTP